MSRSLKTLWVWGPVVLGLLGIFFASSLSDPGPMPGDLNDKSAHFIAYGVMGLLFLRAFSGARAEGATWKAGLLAVVFSSLYGISDEFHQSFVPGRTPDILDWRADTLGALVAVLIGMAIAAAWARWRPAGVDRAV